jgi:ubiquinone/menaquinone biosynthesis C-methylase UbiE
MIINLLKQKYHKQILQRELEPKLVMDNLDQADEYYRGGNEGSLLPQYELILDKLCKIIPSGGNWLDICCGSGNLLGRFVDEFNGFEFLGVDLSESMLDVAKSNFEIKNFNNVSLKKLDALQINNLNKKFDVITWNFASHHMDNEEIVLKIINKALGLLTDKAILFIYDLNRPKTNELLDWFNDKYNSGYGEIYKKDAYYSLRAAFAFDEYENILKKSNWNDYEHAEPMLGNVFQFICSKVHYKNEVKRKVECDSFYFKLNYYLLKLMFRGKI